ncbi:MAG: hypothetical protein ACJ8CR_11460, partial [Roseiflexaceae bacterium]
DQRLFKNTSCALCDYLTQHEICERWIFECENGVLPLRILQSLVGVNAFQNLDFGGMRFSVLGSR